MVKYLTNCIAIYTICLISNIEWAISNVNILYYTPQNTFIIFRPLIFRYPDMYDTIRNEL